MSSTQTSEQNPGAAASHASSNSSKSSADWQKYYDLLVKRRELALKPSNKSKSAAWWNFFEVVLVKDPATGSATNVVLKCTLCEQQLSSSNTSRIAESHLAKGGCSKIKCNAGIAAEVADRLHAKKPVEEVQHKGEVNALERLVAKKRKAETPSVAHAFMKPDQQLKAREALGDFFLEASEAVAVNLIGHPAMLKFCALVGIKPMTRQTLISTHLDRRYEEKQQALNQNLQQQSIGIQLGTDGWKRKHVNEGQKLLNFIANYPNGGTAFLAFADTQGAVMDHLEFLRIMKAQISSLAERLGSVEKVLGCITDREAAVQKAFKMLEAEYHWMVNLVCQAHGLALLLKDLYKHVPELKEPLDAAIEISNFLGSHAWFRKLVHEKQKQIFGRILEICSHVETRFGSRVMVCRDVLSSAEALQRAVNDPSFQIDAAGAQEIRRHITDFSFVESLQRAVRLLEPILALLQSLEQDKPLLSQCLPAWYSVYQHVQSQAQENLHCFDSMKPVLRKRFLLKCYHPAMAAAFLLDPVYYKEDSTHTKYIPDDAFIDKMDSTLGVDIWKDARKVLHRLAGQGLEGLVTIQLTMLQVNGINDVQVGAELIKKRALPDTIGRHVFEYDSTYRRAVWLPQGHLGKEYKALAAAAMRVLSLHATSCAPERNWSVLGQLFRKNRSSLGISRAEKMVFVSSVAKVANRDLKSTEEAELELLCSAVAEESFGTAMVDCVLTSESS